MVTGKTSGFTINHINVKILVIIDKYVPLAVTSNNQFIAPPYLEGRNGVVGFTVNG